VGRCRRGQAADTRGAAPPAARRACWACTLPQRHGRGCARAHITKLESVLICTVTGAHGTSHHTTGRHRDADRQTELRQRRPHSRVSSSARLSRHGDTSWKFGSPVLPPARCVARDERSEDKDVLPMTLSLARLSVISVTVGFVGRLRRWRRWVQRAPTKQGRAAWGRCRGVSWFESSEKRKKFSALARCLWPAPLTAKCEVLCMTYA